MMKYIYVFNRYIELRINIHDTNRDSVRVQNKMNNDYVVYTY